MDRRKAPALAVAAASAAFAWACIAFVRQPILATFADDSVSYLVMAQVFSPWAGAAPPVAEAYLREAFYPPLYPLVLALLGAAHDIARAHVVTALLLSACLPLVYLLGRAWLEKRWAAWAAVVVAALLPGMWVGAKGILSEPLYALVLLATLLVLQSEGRKQRWQLALCMVGLVLTRTAGIALVAAYAAWVLTRRTRSATERLRALVAPLCAAAAYGVWWLLRPASAADINLRFMAERASALAGDGNLWSSVALLLLRQADAMAQAWGGALLLFWVEGNVLRPMLAGLVGCLALAGLLLRFRAGRADAWLMGAYVATFLAWPFYDQMGRFIFPALPVLVLYAFVAAERSAAALRRPPTLAYGLTALLAGTLAAPALAFIHQRSKAASPYREMVEWYRTPDLARARARADVHIGLHEDMRAIRERVGESERVMWVAPAYIALLAGRRGVAAPDERLQPEAYRRAIAASGADYVFITTYHPRDTLSDAAWQAGMRALQGRYTVAYAGTRPGSTLVTSMLFKAK